MLCALRGDMENLLGCVTRSRLSLRWTEGPHDWQKALRNVTIQISRWWMSLRREGWRCVNESFSAFSLVSWCPVSVALASSPRAVWLASLSLGLSRALQSSRDSIPVPHSLPLWLPQPAYSEAANYARQCVCASVWPERSPVCWPRVLARVSLRLLPEHCRWSPERDQRGDGWWFH